MSEHERRVEALSQQLRDERRLRDAAERKAARQAEKSQIWRDRAEERMDRIDRLVEQREQRGSLMGRLRANLSDLRPSKEVGGNGAEPDASDTTARARATEGFQPVPALPHVQLAHLVADVDLTRVVAETTGHDLAGSGAGFFEADVVLVEEAALAAASDEVQERFAEWEALDARQPLVWAGAPRQWHGPVTVVGDDVEVPATFDPATDRPVGRPGEVDAATLPEAPEPGSHAAAAAAARATPLAGDDDPVRAADLRRRSAWATQHPAAVGARLLAAAGWSFEDPTLEVCGVLVSNRPDDLRRQLLAMPDQLHRPLRLRVGCHGFSSGEVAAELSTVAEQLPVDVDDLPGDRPLGWCLNRVVEQVPSPVLAKIDDDDHYGPGYLLDAVQALTYSGAAIIGRVCSFTHLEGQGRTVLRRIGEEERYYDGTLVGATMVFLRSAWERAPFAHKTLAEDVSLQRGTMTAGERMYVASRWDFVYNRRAGSDNTWRAPDEHFLANARDAWEGWQPHRADLAGGA